MTTSSRWARPKKSKFRAPSGLRFIPWVEATAKEFRLAIRPDAQPEAGHYYRSDHFSLARVGIPVFSINEGMKFKGHDEAWGLAQDKEYAEKHYHQPSDEYHPDMDFVGDAAMARFGFALGWEAASLPSSSDGRRATSSKRPELKASSEPRAWSRLKPYLAGQGAPAACHCFTFAANSSCGIGTAVRPSPDSRPTSPAYLP